MILEGPKRGKTIGDWYKIWNGDKLKNKGWENRIKYRFGRQRWHQLTKLPYSYIIIYIYIYLNDY
jgi:hypothetical protein